MPIGIPINEKTYKKIQYLRENQKLKWEIIAIRFGMKTSSLRSSYSVWLKKQRIYPFDKE
jgi:hypothetical protein